MKIEDHVKSLRMRRMKQTESDDHETLLNDFVIIHMRTCQLKKNTKVGISRQIKDMWIERTQRVSMMKTI